MRKHLIALATAGGLVALCTTAVQSASAQGVGGVSPPAGVVSSTPVTDTPHLKTTDDNPTQQIRQIVQCGNTMYAVGSFTTIIRESSTYTRSDIVSFSATAPYAVSSLAPAVSGSDINSIAFNGSNCADAYIGGDFTSVNGTSVKNVAEISTTTGNVVTTFGHSAGGSVQTVLGVAGHILVGGYFTSINGSSADPYFTSLNPTTGSDDGFLRLNISGNYNFPGVSSNATRVFNQALSHSGQLDLVMGDFTSVGGLARQQIFMLNLATTPATVTGWSSPQWDGSQGEATPSDPTNGYPYECATVEPFYIQAAAWSPTDSEIYIGTTGYHPNGWPTGETPRNGLCDVAAAFPATQSEVLDTWINYTGCDSLYAAAADANAAYFGGHERYSMNPNDCDALGPGGYNAPGMEGLQPTTGDLFVNSAGNAGYYSRARGLGADDMLATSAGLWIASDNFDGSQTCGSATNLAGICFLPYT
ncbi:MAG: hypothetical protein ABSB76_08795 [Streptosporangiaceae bacterium]